MKYVLVTLVGGHKLYSMGLFWEYISKLNQPPEEIWVSCTPAIYAECLKEYGLSVPIKHIHGSDDTGDDQIHSTTAAREALRRAIIESDYEWSMWLDNDMLVPEDMVEIADAHLAANPKLDWIHSYHPCREDGGETDRHGLGSCFISRELLGIPFVMATVNDRKLGDDFLWINWVGLFVRMGKVEVKHGNLFDIKHYREDGEIISWKST